MRTRLLCLLLLTACAPTTQTAFVPTPAVALTEYNISDGARNFYGLWVGDVRLIDRIQVAAQTLGPPRRGEFRFWPAEGGARPTTQPFEVWYFRNDANGFASYLSCGAFWKPQFAVLRGMSNPELTQLDQFAKTELKLTSYVLEQHLEPFLPQLAYSYLEAEKHPPQVNRINAVLRRPTPAEERRVRATDNALDCQVR